MQPRKPQPSTIDVQTRYLLAESAASAALALIQHPAMWESLQTLSLLLERIEGDGAELGADLLNILHDSSLSEAEAETAAKLLTALDAACQSWAATAHPPLVAF